MSGLDPSDPGWVCGWLMATSSLLGLLGVGLVGEAAVARCSNHLKSVRREVVSSWLNLAVTTTILISLTTQVPRVVHLSRLDEAFSKPELETVFLSFQVVAHFLIFDLAFRRLHWGAILHHVLQLAIIGIGSGMVVDTDESSAASVVFVLYSLLLSGPIHVARLLDRYGNCKAWKWLRLASVSNAVVQTFVFSGLSLVVFRVFAVKEQDHYSYSRPSFPWNPFMMWVISFANTALLAIGLHESAILWEDSRISRAKTLLALVSTSNTTKNPASRKGDTTESSSNGHHFGGHNSGTGAGMEPHTSSFIRMYNQRLELGQFHLPGPLHDGNCSMSHPRQSTSPQQHGTGRIDLISAWERGRVELAALYPGSLEEPPAQNTVHIVQSRCERQRGEEDDCS